MVSAASSSSGAASSIIANLSSQLPSTRRSSCDSLCLPRFLPLTTNSAFLGASTVYIWPSKWIAKPSTTSGSGSTMSLSRPEPSDVIFLYRL